MKLKLLSLLVMMAAAQAGAQVTNDMISKDAATTNDVLSSGLGTQGQRYSPLTDVNAKSISKLVPVWSMSFGGEKQRGQQSQPLVYDGVMYVANAKFTIAVEAATGKTLWRTPGFILPCLAFPVLFYLLFGVMLSKAQHAEYLLVSYAAFGVMGPALFNFGANVATERAQGWLTLKQISPAPIGSWLFGKTLSCLLLALLIILLLELLVKATAWASTMARC